MDTGIIYHFDNLQQFLEELDDILSQGQNSRDSAIFSVDRYIKYVSKFQDKYLESKMDFMDSCYKLLDSPIYQSFSDKVIENIIQRAARRTDVNELRVLYNILFLAGKENKKVFVQMINVQERKFVTKFKNHICDGDRLQQISARLLFEICCVQRLSNGVLNLIDEFFINHLLDLVEKTRDDEDETFNYSVILLILSFNEQFMLAAAYEVKDDDPNTVLRVNPVLRVLKTRIGSSKTFGENVIFMLNRAVDHHIPMLILKLLYVIFTTPETFEYFYTNDLRVLIDVFIRELYDLPEESESLRYTYLRVLFPLLKNTQLCQYRYKQHQIYSLLLDLIGYSTNQFKPISSTMQRLVNRCLETDYLDGIAPHNYGNRIERAATPNAIVMGLNAAGNTNGNANGNGFTVGVVGI